VVIGGEKDMGNVGQRVETQSKNKFWGSICMVTTVDHMTLHAENLLREINLK
jgi:hypothetical protein